MFIFTSRVSEWKPGGVWRGRKAGRAAEEVPPSHGDQQCSDHQWVPGLTWFFKVNLTSYWPAMSIEVLLNLPFIAQCDHSVCSVQTCSHRRVPGNHIFNSNLLIVFLLWQINLDKLFFYFYIFIFKRTVCSKQHPILYGCDCTQFQHLLQAESVPLQELYNSHKIVYFYFLSSSTV